MRWTTEQQKDLERLAERAREVDPIILQIVEGTSNVQKLIISGIACGHSPNR